MILVCAFFMCACSNKTVTLEKALTEYIDKCNAEIGVAVLFPKGDTVVVNDGMYPMNSVLKLFQSLPTAQRLSACGIRWDSIVSVSRSELDPDTWSPMLDFDASDTLRLPYGKIMEYAVSMSDNNACDWMFDHVMAIDSVSSYWHDRGLNGFELKWKEKDMHADHNRSLENVVSPLSAALLVKTVFETAMFSSDFNTSQVGGLLAYCSTGGNRIPAPLKEHGVIVAHKTGTGFDDENGNPTGVNDVAFVVLPDGVSYALAVFVKTSGESLSDTEKMIADISCIVYRYASIVSSRVK